MIHNRLFEYEKLDRITHDDGKRYYVSPQGHHLDSVTTILSATSHAPELEAWQKRVGLVEAERVRTEATGLGSLMHEHLECHVQGIARPGGTNLVRKMAASMADQIIRKGLDDVNEVWGMEEMLYFPGLYAGTADLIGLHRGEPAIMDYKTTKRRKSRDKIEDYSLQMAAYALAHDELHGTDIRKGVIYMVSRDLEYQEFVFEGDEFIQCKQRWLNRVEVFLKVKEQLAR